MREGVLVLMTSKCTGITVNGSRVETLSWFLANLHRRDDKAARMFNFLGMCKHVFHSWEYTVDGWRQERVI